MPHGGAVTLRDIVGKIGVLSIECDRCAEAGRYLIANLIYDYGLDVALEEILASITAGCPRRRPNSRARCLAHMPELRTLRP